MLPLHGLTPAVNFPSINNGTSLIPPSRLRSRLNWNQTKKGVRKLLHGVIVKKACWLYYSTLHWNNYVFKGGWTMAIFKRSLFKIKWTYHCHFTSYWRYCFLHSGVMWDERCSANFILPEQLSPQTSVKSKSGCPLPRRRDFGGFQSTCWLNVRWVSPAHSATPHSTSVSSR